MSSAAPSHADITDRLKDLLRQRFTGEEWALVEEFRAWTGSVDPMFHRVIDGVAVGLWASNPRVIALEVKASRQDFIRELSNPEKRRLAWSISTDAFFVVERGVCQASELPEGWGLIERRGGRLVKVKAAQQRSLERVPRQVFAAMARRAAAPVEPRAPGVLWKHLGEEIPLDELRAAALKIRDDDRRAAELQLERDRHHLAEEREGLAEQLDVAKVVAEHFGQEALAPGRLAALLTQGGPNLADVRRHLTRARRELQTAAELVGVKE